jgi:hypothetical protein
MFSKALKVETMMRATKIILAGLALGGGALAMAQEAAQLVGCTVAGRFPVDQLGTPRLDGTGDARLDSTIDADSAALRTLFGVNAPALVIEEKGGPNALATPETYPDLLRAAGLTPEAYPDGTVFLGLKLVRNELHAGRRDAIPAILGHEFGHVLQNVRHCPLPRGKWRELFADFLSGFFTARRREARRQDAFQAFATFADKGDFGYTDEDHHGTPQERGAAFLAGYRCGGNADAAYTSGLAYFQVRMGN